MKAPGLAHHSCLMKMAAMTMTTTFIIMGKRPLCYTHIPVQSRESSGRTLNQDIACMILYNFTDSPKRPSEPHPVPPPLPQKSQTQTAGLLWVKPPLWGEPTASSSNPPSVPCVCTVATCMPEPRHHFSEDASGFGLQPVPGQL